ncbi:MAG: YraN family protein [Sedimentibacter sp.]
MYEKNKGFEYEKIAEKYLLDNNYAIEERNFTCRLGEIDIIARKDGILHFIEVKGKKNTEYGYPREAVTLSKQKKLIKVVKYYFMLAGSDDFLCQFDVIEVIMDEMTINHIENAF